MKAVAHNARDIAALVDIELPKPTPGPRDLLVKVEAVSVNPVDTKQRKTDTPSPRVLGWDAAGTVAAVGAQVTLFKPGEAVYYAGDVTRPGCNSEFHLVDERIVGRKPTSLDFAQAAAVPLTAITAWEAFFDRMKIARDRGASVLIINGAGGVGSIGIQLAKLGGLKVIATASRPETVAWVKELGADHVVDHRKPLRPQVEALGLKQVDYIANFSGELDNHWAAMADLVAPQGAVVAIVGNREPLAMDMVRSKSATVCWELMFTRPRFQTPDMIEQHKLLNQVAAWLDSGKLRSTLREALSPINAANLRKAHEKLESGRMIGKLVLHGWA
ncbi:MAG TPA: zinc-binding alcohol dehydrogenase family protein [Burkholderiales bacterium]|jgi:zinc-binding alcohol dehydrogenase family protein|nr:zinc-binding alcohol dehydrogenase family protein [Burkholderiales bacterium]